MQDAEKCRILRIDFSWWVANFSKLSEKIEGPPKKELTKSFFLSPQPIFLAPSVFSPATPNLPHFHKVLLAERKLLTFFFTPLPVKKNNL